MFESLRQWNQRWHQQFQQQLQVRLRESTIGKWYAGRDANERPVIAGVACLIVIAVLWSVVWKPISDWRDIEANRFENAQALLDWMRANEATARRTVGAVGSQNTPKRSLLPVITRAANGEGIILNRLQPESSGAVSVVVQAQPFNSVLRWLNQMQENNNIVVQRVSLDAEGHPGLVNAQLRLQ